MSGPKDVVNEIVKRHASRITKEIVYPAVWNHIPEDEMDKLTVEVGEQLAAAMRDDILLMEAITAGHMFVSSGKLNAGGIHQAILQTAQASKEPTRSKLMHLATNAEIVFRSARMMKGSNDGNSER